MNLYILVLLVSLFGFAYGQTFNWGPCPAAKPMTPIDVNKSLGRWYENSRTFNAYETAAICITSTLALNGTTLTVTNRQVDGLTQAEKFLIGTAKINTTIPTADVTYPNGKNTMKILATDYTGYMVVYQCTDLFLFSYWNIWVETRDRFPSQGVKDAANAALTAQKFDITKLNSTEQFWCGWFY